MLSPHPAITQTTHQQWGDVYQLTKVKKPQTAKQVVTRRLNRRAKRRRLLVLTEVISIVFGFAAGPVLKYVADIK